MIQLHNKPILSEKIADICRAYGISQMAVFGSVARSENDEKSDLDLLVKFGEPKSLLDVIRIERELSKYFQTRVDLLTKEALGPHLRESILSDLEIIYDRQK